MVSHSFNSTRRRLGDHKARRRLTILRNRKIAVGNRQKKEKKRKNKNQKRANVKRSAWQGPIGSPQVRPYPISGHLSRRRRRRRCTHPSFTQAQRCRISLLHARRCNAAASPSFTQAQRRRISSLMAHAGTAPPSLPHAALSCVRSACPPHFPYLLLLLPQIPILINRSLLRR